MCLGFSNFTSLDVLGFSNFCVQLKLYHNYHNDNVSRFAEGLRWHLVVRIFFLTYRSRHAQYYMYTPYGYPRYLHPNMHTFFLVVMEEARNMDMSIRTITTLVLRLTVGNPNKYPPLVLRCINQA